MYLEQPDRIGRTFLIATALWGGVALLVFAVFTLAVPDRPLGVREAPICRSSVPMGLYDASVATDPARAVVTAASPCTSNAPGKDRDHLLRAWLDGAELDGSPSQPPPTIDAALRARGAERYQAHCANCHGTTGDGAGPDACALDPRPAVHKSGVFSLRTTEHEALPTDEDLFRTISRGIHGTAMPPWIVLPERDRWALVAHVKSLSKQFEEDVAPPPVELGHAPEETPEHIALGRKLYTSSGCSSCHGDTGLGDGVAASSLSVRPRNFTGGHFHRGSSVADIHATLVTGLDGTPMASFAKVLSADDMWNLSMFVHGLAPRLIERNGLWCPAATRPLDPQELFGVRNLIATTRLQR